MTAVRPTSLNRLAAEIHAANAHWWHDPATGERLDRNKGEMFMLMVSELAECMEGERKDLMDTHLTHRKMAEVELADTVIRIMDYAGAYKVPLNLWCDDLSRLFDWDNKGEFLFHIVAELVCADDSAAETWHAYRLNRVIRYIEAYAAKHGYDLWGAVAEKREYNRHRADHKPAARLAANGKKW